jgi:hypothetical protein
MVDIYKRVRPQALLQLLPRYHISGALQKDGENLKGLACEFQFQPRFAQFTGLKVNFKDAEAD